MSLRNPFASLRPRAASPFLPATRLRTAWMGAAALCLLLNLSPAQAQNTYTLTPPNGFPKVPVPADNPMNAAKVELGRYLFYDQRLSVNGKGSCATCHDQKLGFADRKPVAVGVTGQKHPRKAMPLANVAYFADFNWADPTVHQLEDQSTTPLFHDHPVELGLREDDRHMLDALATDPVYQRLLPQAFPGDAGLYDFKHVRKALAAFERTLLSGNSPYDRYFYAHDNSAISESAQRGERLFFSQPMRCSRCHGGFTFGGETVFQAQEGGVEFHSTGLYNLPGQFSYPADNLGLYTFTHDPKDVGKFRAPSLRNVAVRAPYMHDGSVKSLDDVLDHYAHGGRLIATGPHAGDGSKNPNKARQLQGFTLTQGDRDDLKAFLNSLIDEQFLNNPQFSNPWPQKAVARNPE